MSINAAMEMAFAGLRATQAGLDVVSSNIANAGSVGYTRRSLNVQQQVAGGRTTGVDILGTTRVLNDLIQQQLRLETAGAAYTAARASGTAQTNNLFDKPGGAGSLSSVIASLTNSLQTLASSPSTSGNRLSVLSTASDMASTLNTVSDQVRQLRQQTESAIGTNVQKASDLLQQIQIMNAKVVATPTPALQDQRDSLIDQLSTLIDVKVTQLPSGGVSLSTTGGLSLFDGQNATKLDFDAQSIGPGSVYSTDPTKRTVGTISVVDITGAKRDILASGMIRSGEIAAQIELRDKTLVTAQAQLDQLASGLASALSDKTVASTAATAGAQAGFDVDLASLSAGNTFSVSVTDAGGAKRSFTFVKATSAAGATAATSADGTVRGIDFSGGMASVVTQVSAALGGAYTVSNPAGSTLRILNDGTGANSVTSLAATSTVTTLNSGGSEFPLFVDGGRGNAAYTGSFEGGSQLAGFASRITLNPAVKNDPSSLVMMTTTTGASDTTRPLFMLDRLTNTKRTFSGSAQIDGSSSPFTGTITDFATRVIQTQAAQTNSADTLNQGQKAVLSSLQGKFAEESGVNMDTELSSLVQLQTAYSANARILSATKDMMDMLLRIGA